MLTVIIPVLNEEQTIANVIRFCQQFVWKNENHNSDRPACRKGCERRFLPL